MDTPSLSFSIQPYSSKRLAEFYGVHRNTFHRWLEPFKGEIGPKRGYYYTIAQVRIIVERLGLPGCVLTD